MKILNKLYAVSPFVFFLVFCGCLEQPVPQVWDAAPPSPHAARSSIGASCAAACEHIGPKGLQCEEGNPISMNVSCDQYDTCMNGQHCMNGGCYATCAQFCVDTMSRGIPMFPECVAQVRNCREINNCFYTNR